MPDFLQLKPGVEFVSAGPAEALFHYYGSRYLVRGPFGSFDTALLCRFLLRPRQLIEIQNQFADRGIGSIEKLVEALRGVGFLEVSADPLIGRGLPSAGDKNEPSTALTEFLRRFHLRSESREQALRKLADTKVVELHFSNPLFELGRSLRGVGIESHRQIDLSDMSTWPEALSSIKSEDFMVLTAAWVDSPKLRRLNVNFLERELRYLIVLADYFGGSVGPVLGLEDGPCFECLHRRRAVHEVSPESVGLLEEHFLNRDPFAIPVLEPFRQQMSSVVATEIFKFVVQDTPPKILNGLYELDLLNHRTVYHPVLPVPVCRICGAANKTPVEMTEGVYQNE